MRTPLSRVVPHSRASPRSANTPTNRSPSSPETTIVQRRPLTPEVWLTPDPVRPPLGGITRVIPPKGPTEDHARSSRSHCAVRLLPGPSWRSCGDPELCRGDGKRERDDSY